MQHPYEALAPEYLTLFSKVKVRAAEALDRAREILPRYAAVSDKARIPTVVTDTDPILEHRSAFGRTTRPKPLDMAGNVFQWVEAGARARLCQGLYTLQSNCVRLPA
jgi:hypothetical protein